MRYQKTSRTACISIPVILGCVFFFFFSLSSAHAQQWSGILDPTRAIDWSEAGIPGGIPVTRTQCGATIGAGASQSAIQSALNSCASAHPVTASSPGDGGYVLLGPGTFTVSSISIPANVTLRGSGADQTTLNETGSGNVINMDVGGDPSSGAVSVTSGGTKGSQSIVVSNAASFAVGQFAYITEINSNGVSNVGSGGTCSWCDAWGSGTRNKGQIVAVTSKSGSTLGITPALYSDYTNSPQASPYAMLKYAGVEDVRLYANNTGHTQNIYMRGCAYCWVKGIANNYVDGNGNHASIHSDYRCEVRDNYFSNAYVYTNGSTESEMQLAYKTSACLIENNIMERTQTGINAGYGSAGNVIAYNYLEGQLDQGSPTLMGTGTYTHGAHPQYNLFEGNVTQTIYTDAVWGTTGYVTAFRNWAKGTGFTCTPLSGRGTVNCTGTNKTAQNAAARAMQIDGLSTNGNFVGNVVGSAEQNALSDAKVASVAYPAGRAGWNGTVYGWSWGYTFTSDGGSGALDNANACNTAFVTGNYTLTGNSLTWASGLGCANTSGTAQTLPASFYRSSKPAWWDSTIPWPAIGPDVTGGNGPGGHTTVHAANPAMNCFYNVMGGTDGGAGGPYSFNASKCYQSSSGGATPPQPPSGLSAIAH